MKQKGFVQLIIILVIAVLVIGGYLFWVSYKNASLTQLQFNQNDVYKVLVEMKKSENSRCGGPCSKSVDYVRAMNNNFAVVESKGISGPGAYFIYKKNGQNWGLVVGGQETPTREWLKSQGVPLQWFYN